MKNTPRRAERDRRVPVPETMVARDKPAADFAPTIVAAL
jgi:hypothetical protein